MESPVSSSSSSLLSPALDELSAAGSPPPLNLGGGIGVRLEPAQLEDEVFARMEEEEIPLVGTFDGTGAIDIGIGIEQRQGFARAYNQLKREYLPILQQKHPGQDIEFLGVDMMNLEIHYELDGDREIYEIENTEDPQIAELRDLFVESSDFKSHHFPVHRAGEKSPEATERALSQSGYRLDSQIKTHRYDHVQNFLREFGETIFDGLTPKECYQLRRQLHMKDVIHQGLGIKIERKLLAVQAEIDQIADVRDRHRRELVKTVTKLNRLKIRLNQSDRYATFLAISYRFRRKAQAAHVAQAGGVFDEARFRENFKERILESIQSFDGSDRSFVSIRPLAGAVGHQIKDDSVKPEEEQYAHDIVSMTLTGSSVRKDYRELCKENGQEARKDSLEEILFVDVIDRLERSVEELAAYAEDEEAPEPSLECESQALVTLFREALSDTVNVGDEAPLLADEFIQYLAVDLFREMASRMETLDQDFDNFAVPQGGALPGVVNPDDPRRHVLRQDVFGVVGNGNLAGNDPQDGSNLPAGPYQARDGTFYRYDSHGVPRREVDVLAVHPQRQLERWAKAPDDQSFKEYVLGHGLDLSVGAADPSLLQDAMRGLVAQGVPYIMREED